MNSRYLARFAALSYAECMLTVAMLTPPRRGSPTSTTAYVDRLMGCLPAHAPPHRARRLGSRLEIRRGQLEPFLRWIDEALDLGAHHHEVEIVDDRKERGVLLHEDAVDLPVERRALLV